MLVGEALWYVAIVQPHWNKKYLPIGHELKHFESFSDFFLHKTGLCCGVFGKAKDEKLTMLYRVADFTFPFLPRQQTMKIDPWLTAYR